MKLRILLSTLLVLLISIVASSVVLYRFFQAERLRLMDQQLETMASTILAEGIERSRTEELTGLIAHALGDEPSEYIIGYWDQYDQLLYANSNYTKIMGAHQPIPRSPERLIHRLGNYSVRILNLRDLQNHVLQVGLLMHKNELRWQGLSKTAAPYLAGILAILIVATFLLSSFFLRPLLKVGNYLEHFSDSLLSQRTKPELPKDLLPFMKSPLQKDEFSKLIETLEKVSDRLSLVFRLNQSAAAQMAHELKTPLTVIRNTLEMPLLKAQAASGEEKKGRLEEPEIEELILEVDHLSQTINDFLNWSRAAYLKPAESSSLKFHSLRALAEEFRDQWNERHSGRIQLEAGTDLKVLADLEHLRQIFKNLLQNALSYSKPGTVVKIKIEGHSFSVENEGDPIPVEVLARLGSPFNRGSSHTRGTGLGLAWIHTLSKIYNWKLQFDYHFGRQAARLEFEKT